METRLLKIPAYQISHKYSLTPPLPFNLTISLLSKCNSRCLTCNIWKKEYDMLTGDEYVKIFKSLGKNIIWGTFSGGEPFLRDDLTRICGNFYSICRPSFINIPTNGILFNKIPGMVKEIANYCSKARITINISLDHWEEKHDKIRQVPGNFHKTIETYNKLKELKLPNLTIGIHTVLSRYNIKDFQFIHKKLTSLNPDSYIMEMAEERDELENRETGITPSVEDYNEAINFLLGEMKKNKSTSSGLTQAFRKVYYELSKAILTKKTQVIPCYGSIASAQIMPDGDVWPCCIRGESIGNLREKNYNFPSIWKDKKAKEIRKTIKNKECWCPLANAAYTNIMCNTGTAFKVINSLLTYR